MILARAKAPPVGARSGTIVMTDEDSAILPEGVRGEVELVPGWGGPNASSSA